MTKDYPPYLDYPKPSNPVTNYDRLISKTPEELAEWIAKRAPGTYASRWLDWLKQEATDEK